MGLHLFVVAISSVNASYAVLLAQKRMKKTHTFDMFVQKSIHMIMNSKNNHQQHYGPSFSGIAKKSVVDH